jgi:hypothetical protein
VPDAATAAASIPAAATAAATTTAASTGSGADKASSAPSQKKDNKGDGDSNKSSNKPTIVFTSPRRPAMLPPRRGAIYSMLSTREMDIYSWSDSEDEMVELVGAKSSSSTEEGASTDQAAIKFSLRA